MIIYPSRAVEQSKVYPHRSLLNGEQVHRIYLDELGEVRSLPISVGAVVLTIVEASEAPEAARELLARADQEALTPEERGDIIDIVTSIMVYKFTNSSQAEVREMLGLNLSEEPRAIREAKEEGERSLILRLLTRQVGELPEELRSRINTLSLEQLENLGEALLEFEAITDLEAWFGNLE